LECAKIPRRRQSNFGSSVRTLVRLANVGADKRPKSRAQKFFFGGSGGGGKELDLAALDKIWANSEDIYGFETGHANYGWTDYRNSHLRPELKEFKKNTRYAFSDLKVKASGSLAYATFKYTLSADQTRR